MDFASDVNRDGFADAVIAEPDHAVYGAVRIHHGNGVVDASTVPDLGYRTETLSGDPVSPGNVVTDGSVRFGATGRSAAGRTRVRLAWQFAEAGNGHRVPADSAPSEARAGRPVQGPLPATPPSSRYGRSQFSA